MTAFGTTGIECQDLFFNVFLLDYYPENVQFSDRQCRLYQNDHHLVRSHHCKDYRPNTFRESDWLNHPHSSTHYHLEIDQRNRDLLSQAELFVFLLSDILSYK